LRRGYSGPAKLAVHPGSIRGFALYEASKDNAAITLSSKIFHAKNPSLSAEWDKIREKLKL